MHRDIQRRSPAFTPAAETAIEQVDPGIRRQILGHGPDLMVCRVSVSYTHLTLPTIYSV